MLKVVRKRWGLVYDGRLAYGEGVFLNSLSRKWCILVYSQLASDEGSSFHAERLNVELGANNMMRCRPSYLNHCCYLLILYQLMLQVINVVCNFFVSCLLV